MRGCVFLRFGTLCVLRVGVCVRVRLRVRVYFCVCSRAHLLLFYFFLIKFLMGSLQNLLWRQLSFLLITCLMDILQNPFLGPPSPFLLLFNQILNTNPSGSSLGAAYSISTAF